MNFSRALLQATEYKRINNAQCSKAKEAQSTSVQELRKQSVTQTTQCAFIQYLCVHMFVWPAERKNKERRFCAGKVNGLSLKDSLVCDESTACVCVCMKASKGGRTATTNPESLSSEVRKCAIIRKQSD